MIQIPSTTHEGLFGITLDPQESQDLIAQMMKVVADDVGAIPMYYAALGVAFRGEAVGSQPSQRGRGKCLVFRRHGGGARVPNRGPSLSPWNKDGTSGHRKDSAAPDRGPCRLIR